MLRLAVHEIHGIRVPEAHVRERRVGPTHEDEGGAEGPLRPLIRIGSAVECPVDAFAAVRYRSAMRCSMTRLQRDTAKRSAGARVRIARARKG